MRYLVRHRTDYRYEAPVFDSHNEVRLTPLDAGAQRVHRTEVKVDPAVRLFAYRDWLGNTVHYFHVPEWHVRLIVEAESEVDVTDGGGSGGGGGEGAAPDDRLRGEAGPSGPTVGDLRHAASSLRETYHDFLTPSRRCPHLPEVAGLAPKLGGRADREPLLHPVLEAVERARRRLAYTPRATRVDTPLARALELGKGVCQDLAHLGVAMLRHMGIPARYVSGYLRAQPEEAWSVGGGGGDDGWRVATSGQGHGGLGARGAHAGGGPHEVHPGSHPERRRRSHRRRRLASHAWLEAYIPGRGFVGFDPTHGRAVDPRYIKVATGRDYDDVVPVKGIFRGECGKQRMRVHVDVIPLPEASPERAEEPI